MFCIFLNEHLVGTQRCVSLLVLRPPSFGDFLTLCDRIKSPNCPLFYILRKVFFLEALERLELAGMQRKYVACCFVTFHKETSQLDMKGIYIYITLR